MEKINVQLYGGKSIFGGRETPLEADIIYCDCKDKCSLYRNGNCLNCRGMFSDRCKKGKVETVKGYTSRAAKYNSFRSKYKNDEFYNKLTYPNIHFAVIDDEYWFNLVYVNVAKEIGDSDNYAISNTGFKRGECHIPVQDMNVELLDRMLSFTPTTMIGATKIETYHEKIVPKVLEQVQICAPELYNELTEKYPKYDNVTVSHIGDLAYTKTLVNGTKIKSRHGDIGTLKDGKIYCDNFRGGFIPFGGASAAVVVEIKDNAVYEIESDDQWDENTIFR